MLTPSDTYHQSVYLKQAQRESVAGTTCVWIYKGRALFLVL